MGRNPNEEKSIFEALKSKGLGNNGPLIESGDIVNSVENTVGDTGAFSSLMKKSAGPVNNFSDGGAYNSIRKRAGVVKGVDKPISTANEGADVESGKDLVRRSLIDNVSVMNYFGVLKDLLSLYAMNELSDGVLRDVPAEVVREVKEILREFGAMVY